MSNIDELQRTLLNVIEERAEAFVAWRAAKDTLDAASTSETQAAEDFQLAIRCETDARAALEVAHIEGVRA